MKRAAACERILTAGLLLFVAAFAAAQEDTPPWQELPHSDKGADSCLRCHDESSDYPVLDIFKTRHGHGGNPDAPFGEQLQCESCHGPGEEHGKRVRRNRPRPAIPAFGENALATKEEENAICVSCHARTNLDGWSGSHHESADVGCADCHQVHAVDDRMLVAQTETDTCIGCHKGQKADLFRPSSHPVRFGEMSCSDCHAPHGSMGDQELVRNTVNDTCNGCHAEKRGPFLWEHEPVAEDCGACHLPHGSNHPNLLKVRQPLLCQQCHSRVGHPGLAFTSELLPGRSELGVRSSFALAQGCGNCHAQVHGSNHPSGASLTR